MEGSGTPPAKGTGAEKLLASAVGPLETAGALSGVADVAVVAGSATADTALV